MPPPPDPFDPDSFDDAWANDPSAPKEPGAEELGRGPAALLDPGIRGEIEYEILYQQVRTALPGVPPPPDDSTALRYLFLGIAALCPLSFLPAGAFEAAAFSFLALAVHDLGRWLGARMLGSRDRWPLFLPWPVRVDLATPAGRAGLGLLCGPLPGLTAGVVGHLVGGPSPWSAGFVAMNAMALLPLQLLPGYKLLDLLPTARNSVASGVLRAVVAAAAILLAVVADWAVRMPLLSAALVTLLSIPFAVRQARSRRALAALLPPLPPRWERMSDVQRRRVFDLVLHLRPRLDDADKLAVLLLDLHRQASPSVARPASAALLLMGYLAGPVAVALIICDL